MEWVLILGLGFWVWLQSQRIDTLSRRLQQLEDRDDDDYAPAPASALQWTAPASAAAPPAEPELEPLLLDTPLPPVSNDIYEEEEIPPREAAPLPLHEPAVVLELRTPAPAETKAPSRSFEKWLAENGLAWIGGGALALGAVFLVAFAAQQGFFTPPMRLGAAVALGLILIATAEWVRRAARDDAAGHPLVGALLAGAGATAFYATAWAAHGLYHYVDWPVAAALLTLCALLLIVLSQLHGQPLGVLAIGAAMLAPGLTSLDTWPSLALTIFISAVGASGFVLAILRRWAWAAAAALLGLYAWFAVCIAADEIVRALALLTIASLGGAAAALRQPLEDGIGETLSWRNAHSILPTSAICISSVFMLWTWLSVAPAANASLIGPALIAILHVGLAALAVRQRAVPPAAFAVTVGALVAGLLMYMRARAYFAPGGNELYLWPLLAAGAVALAALGARPNRHGRVLVASAGAIGAAVLIAFAAFSRPDWSSPGVWAPLFVGGVLLIGAAWLAARDAGAPQADWSVDAWVLAGAALVLIGMESFAPAAPRPAGDAAASLAFAALLAWRGWRGAGFAALGAAALALAHALAPDFSGAVMSGELSLWRSLLFLAAAIAFLFGAAEMASRRPAAKAMGETLTSAAILIVVLAIFLALSWMAAGGVAIPLDAFTETALRALTLIAAGYLALPRRGAEAGLIGRTRGHVLMGMGLLLALFACGFELNPWWGGDPAAIAGPPLLNVQALAFAAPAALALLAARRFYDEQLLPARIYAAASGLFGALWAIMEIRRAFHGADMGPAEIGLFEGACYALAALGGALVLAIVARLRAAKDITRPFTSDLSRITRSAAFGGLALAALILLLARHPWWGGQDPELSTDLMSALAVLSQAAAMGLALVLGRALSRSKDVDAARFAAAAAAVLFAVGFGHAAIRWLYHQGAMDNNLELLLGLEGFAHAVWPLAFVMAASEITARAPGRDSVRAYLYDLQAIWATAIWPALIFAALGLWLIFNPWWGAVPAFVDTTFGAMLGLGTLLLAAWLSAIAPRVPHVRFRAMFERVATIASVGHLFVALSLLIRRIFHGADMRAILEGSSLETWAYSAAWAVFGGCAWAAGTMRDNAILRWCGLIILLGVTAKIMLFDTAALDGLMRAASLIGLAIVVLLVALAARRFGQPAQGSRE